MPSVSESSLYSSQRLFSPSQLAHDGFTRYRRLGEGRPFAEGGEAALPHPPPISAPASTLLMSSWKPTCQEREGYGEGPKPAAMGAANEAQPRLPPKWNVSIGTQMFDKEAGLVQANATPLI
jgi:hypothetical protein